MAQRRLVAVVLTTAERRLIVDALNQYCDVSKNRCAANVVEMLRQPIAAAPTVTEGQMSLSDVLAAP